jgi:type IV pilus assembly protein PilV
MNRRSLVSRHDARRRSRRTRPVRSGFTVVSMIVAIVLLTVGILALGTSNTNTIKGQVLAQNRTNAVAIGRAYLEEVRSRDPWTLQSESAVTVGPDGVEDPEGAYTRRLEVTQERQNLLLVELFIDFPRSTAPVRLITYQYRGSGLSSATP